MSCYEWSSGSIILPSAEFSRVRKHVQKAMHEKWQKAFDDSQRFWKSLTPKQKSDWDEFRRALNSRRFDLDTMWLIDPMSRRIEKPRRVLQSDIEWPNNRTTEFHESDLSLVFKRENRTVYYDVHENNHAREHAGDTALSKAFFGALAKVHWTNGTGGVILGNDEYNRESGYDFPGGGGSYLVDAFGYIGAKEAPHLVGEFLNGKGKKVHVETRATRNGYVGRVVPGSAPRSTILR